MRSASPSNASPRSKPPARTPAASASRCVEPTRSLMLTPSGSRGRDLVLDAELREDQRRDGRGGAVGAVDEHAQRRAPRSACRRRRPPRPRSAPRRPRAARDSPTPAPVGRAVAVGHQRLDAILVVVAELEAVGAEQLDAVVGERVVRGRDDDAEARALLAHEPGDAGRRQHAGAQARGRRPRRCRRTARPRASAPSAACRARPRPRAGPRPRSRAYSAEARPRASATSGLSTSPLATPRTPSVPNSRPP